PAQRARSLGVVTMTREHRVLVEERLDEAGRRDPALEALAEAVWVRHVGEADGDARDIVLLGMGVTLESLAPFSEPGGAQQLAVAITRAREQLVVFSQLAPEDLPVEAPAGVRDLAAFLAVARAGGGAARPVD